MTTTTPTAPTTDGAFALLICRVGGELSPDGTLLCEFATAGSWDNFIVPHLAGPAPTDAANAARAAERLLNLSGYWGATWAVISATLNPSGRWTVEAVAHPVHTGETLTAELIVEFLRCPESARDGRLRTYLNMEDAAEAAWADFHSWLAESGLPPLPKAADA